MNVIKNIALFIFEAITYLIRLVLVFILAFIPGFVITLVLFSIFFPDTITLAKFYNYPDSINYFSNLENFIFYTSATVISILIAKDGNWWSNFLVFIGPDTGPNE